MVKIEVENRYTYTNLNKIKFEWQLLAMPVANATATTPKIIKKGNAGLQTAPGEKGNLNIALPKDAKADAFYLTAIDWKGDTVCTWSWAIKEPTSITKSIVASTRKAPNVAKDAAPSLAIISDGIK